jgi:hypothetical protein
MNPEQSVTKKNQEQLTLVSKVRKRAADLELRERKRSEKWYNILFKADYFNPEYSTEERHLVQISKLSDENIWEIESESSLEKRMLCAEQYLPKPFICGTPFMQETYIETYIDYEDRNDEAPKEVKQENKATYQFGQQEKNAALKTKIMVTKEIDTVARAHRSRILAIEKIRADRLKAEKLFRQNHSSTTPIIASSKVKKSEIGKQSKISSEQFALKKILTSSEITFLANQHLNEDDLYDGRLESRSDYSINAKQLGKSVVIGSKCKLQGHRLRTRSGHCIQCHPSKIAYASRHSEAADLYIAGSYTSKILKVGLTKNIPKREQSLINQSYGGLDDWQIICSIRIPNAGAVESQVHAALQKYKIIKYYIKDGLEQQAEELVEVSLRILLRELIACLKDAQIKDPEKSLKWTKSKTGLIKFYS